MVFAKEQTNRPMNRIDSLEIDLHKFTQLIFDKAAKAIQRRQYKSFQQIVLELDMYIHKKNESRHRPYTIHKN